MLKEGDLWVLTPKSDVSLRIKEFFEPAPGQTHLIKGKLGIGKIILSSEILRKVCEENNRFVPFHEVDFTMFRLMKRESILHLLV